MSHDSVGAADSQLPVAVAVTVFVTVPVRLTVDTMVVALLVSVTVTFFVSVTVDVRMAALPVSVTVIVDAETLGQEGYSKSVWEGPHTVCVIHDWTGVEEGDSLGLHGFVGPPRARGIAASRATN